MSRCTKDDLGCILGSKRAKQLAKEKKLAEIQEVNGEDEVGHVEHSMGVTTIKSCSIQVRCQVATGDSGKQIRTVTCKSRLVRPLLDCIICMM